MLSAIFTLKYLIPQN